MRSIDLYVIEMLAFFIQHANQAIRHLRRVPAVGYIKKLQSWVVHHEICVDRELDRRDSFQGVAAQQIEGSGSVRDDHLVQVRHVLNVVWHVESWNAAKTLARRQIEHLDRIVIFKGGEQAIAFRIRAKVVEMRKALRQSDGFRQVQRKRRAVFARLSNHGPGCKHRQTNQQISFHFVFLLYPEGVQRSTFQRIKSRHRPHPTNQRIASRYSTVSKSFSFEGILLRSSS